MAGFDWGSAGQGAAGGASVGTAFLPGWGTAIGGVLGGIAGGFMGQDNQTIPSFDAAERARSYMERYGQTGAQVGQVGASADQLGRQTAAQLISAGVDPITAQNIASRRAAAARQQGVDSVINSTGQMEAQLAGNLLPYEIQREEDQISLKNLKANEPNTFESFIPLIASSWLTNGKEGGAKIGDWLGGMFNGQSGGYPYQPPTLQHAPLYNVGQAAGPYQSWPYGEQPAWSFLSANGGR